MKIICDVYRGDKRPESYIYVDKGVGLKRVPEELLNLFGELEISFSFVLTEDRKLAKEDSKKVMANLSEQGYHLQMPPLYLGQLGKEDKSL